MGLKNDSLHYFFSLYHFICFVSFLFVLLVLVVFEKRSIFFLFMSTFDSENGCGNRCGTAR